MILSFKIQTFTTLLACLLLQTATVAFAMPDSEDGDIYFEKHIRPILIDRCYECHSAAAKKSEGGLLLDSRDGWAAGGDNGAALVPGDPDKSLIVQAVRYSDDIQMPPDKALPNDDILRIEAWVQMGAPDPRDKASSADQYQNASDPVAGKTHWAFQPLTLLSPETITNSEWPKNAIDALVMAKLEANGLEAREDADPITRLRRVYFQLLGLPPTADQIKAFLADDREDAFEREVDKLLDSPQFGRRWGRHWLDLARYSDSNGLDENFLFREAWRYRNWVIDAINADMPYDEFLQLQLAGDLLPFESIEQRDRQRIASGFLVVGPKVLLGNDPNERRMDVADEQLDTIGRAVLGQTLGCARCHDHKFDPIPTSDYYALAGIFTSTQVMETRHMLGQQRLMERLVGLGTDGREVDESYEAYWRELPGLKERQKQSKAILDLLEKADEPGLTELLEKHADAVAPIANDAQQPIESRIQAQKEFLADLVSKLAKPPAIPPRAMIAADAQEPADEAIRLAGQFNRLGDVVPRGFLQVFDSRAAPIASGASGRIELANWLTDTENGSGNLAARVLANRVWHHLIGRGIVRTVDNFGRTGEPPSHPELLDYMASHLIASDWSIKSLIREVVTSRTFSMSSEYDATSYEIDPDNRLLWRANKRRLDPESLRDAMLLVSGQLDTNPVDSSVSYLGDQATAVGKNENRRRTDFAYRTVYLPIIRNDLPEVLAAFDFADPHTATGMRPQTMAATQALFMLNDDSVMAAAESTVTRLLSNQVFESRPQREQLAAAMIELVLGTKASPAESSAVVDFVDELAAHPSSDDDAPDKSSELRAWATACHAIFASSRFQILE